MSNSVDRLRRLSYAGPTSPIRETQRRVSYVGPTLSSVYQSQELTDPSATGTASQQSSTMYNNIDSVKSRNRRISRSKETTDGLTCSQLSILSDIDRFVKAVSNMDSTVLMPSRLQDIDLNKEPKLPLLNSSIGSPDLFTFFTMVKGVKEELLWGSSNGRNLPNLNHTGSRQLKHVRQPSDDSLGSTGSDQDTDSDLESVNADSVNEDSTSNHLAVAFRHHLQGLQAIMNQLTESADFLSSKYQESIDEISH